MLLGEPAARKSTSVKMLRKLLASSGYGNFAADKTSKEKFLLDLEGITEDVETYGKRKTDNKGYDPITAENLWGAEGTDPREVFIVADEFNEFAGSGNMEFYTTLGNLWDYDNPTQPFTQRLKNSRSVSIYQPTISLLSGNTPELFARAFPPEAIGSGFLSRLLLIHGERSGRRITFPPPPDLVLGESLTSHFRALREYKPGEVTKSIGAEKLLDKIYQEEEPPTDVRFKAYQQRRFTQLMKISLILAVARFQSQIEEENVLEANTILSHAELLMPKAMGEFGKSKNSDIANKVISVIERATRPITIKEIWVQVHRDLPSPKELPDILAGLVQADKLQIVTGQRHNGYLPKKAPRREPKYVDWNLLTQEERDMI